MRPVNRFDAIGMEVAVVQTCPATGLRGKRGKIVDVDFHNPDDSRAWTAPVKTEFPICGSLPMYFPWSELKRWRPKK